MQEYFLPYHHSSIHYLVFGDGEKSLFCFHGYGENGNSFKLLEPFLGKDYTMICIDFPFHGKTEWKEEAFLPADLVSIIQQVNPSSSHQLSLLGYSMGGRVALQIIQLIPQQIERVVLMAPDGLHKNFWYWFSTQTSFGNKIFNFTVQHPAWLFAAMKMAKKLKAINSSFFKIAHYYLDDKKERMLLYKRWTTMRKFRPHLSVIKSILTEKKIPTRFLFGKYDSLILSRRSDFFNAGAGNTEIRIIEAGHQLLKEKYIEETAKLFYQ